MCSICRECESFERLSAKGADDDSDALSLGDKNDCFDIETERRGLLLCRGGVVDMSIRVDLSESGDRVKSRYSEISSHAYKR